MSGEHASLRSLSPSNVFSFSLTRVSQLNISYGTASKLGGHGDGQPSSCTNCAGYALVTMTVLTGSKHSLGKGYLRSIARQLRFGIFLEALPCGPFGLNVTTWCLTKPNGMRQGLDKEFGMNSSFTAKLNGSG